MRHTKHSLWVGLVVLALTSSAQSQVRKVWIVLEMAATHRGSQA